MNNQRVRLNAKTIIWLCAIFIIVPLLVFLLYMIFKEEPKKIEIDNFASIYPDVPGDTKKDIFVNLYNTVQENVEDIDSIPESGALIRDGSWNSSYVEAQNMHYLTFIVDIASLEQSYSGFFKWSNDKNNPYFYGNNGSFSCVNNNERIYENFVCVGQYSNSLSIRFPIIDNFPLIVEYYSDDYSEYTKYKLSYKVEGDKLKIIITDYEGGAYEKALAKIRDLGYDPADYEIQYDNVSSEYNWVFYK